VRRAQHWCRWPFSSCASCAALRGASGTSEGRSRGAMWFAAGSRGGGAARTGGGRGGDSVAGGA